ncbi:TetR family transcriptional regulator [Nocardioides sp. MAH-18]|uniref:TetR family transcriptional regulator n=1 Tax=Nocardioides agri TaxID=2682843 RepID=A0A6L6XWW1_9ACTN|nr:TetR/AcrR family transcriptional regulator [Nocardioides sp. CGMCC 1.13656]MBA2952722.1 TetR/AcrR family transcriptional regulator [Nocardioides sp. CGMCC 1.13656]MVQ51884.1 TetR family transcriptional regulator [Nocardioides sp. MAH-18]
MAASTAGPTTADRVRDAALALFAERGYHGTGIRQLADAAGLSSASLYHYMGTKEELLVAIMRESLSGLVEAGERAADEHPDPRARLVALVGLHVRAHAEGPAQTRVVDDEVRALSPGARAEVVALRDRYEDLWQRTLEAGVADGSFRLGSVPVGRRALLEMCTGVARWWTPSGPLDTDALAAEYAGLALRLVGAADPDAL